MMLMGVMPTITEKVKKKRNRRTVNRSVDLSQVLKGLSRQASGRYKGGSKQMMETSHSLNSGQGSKKSMLTMQNAQ